MLNPRKELKRERRVKIFFSGRILRDIGGSAAVSHPANAVRGIKYAICLHNRTHKAGGAHRRAFRGRPCSRQPQNPAGISAPIQPITSRSE